MIRTYEVKKMKRLHPSEARAVVWVTKRPMWLLRMLGMKSQTQVIHADGRGLIWFNSNTNRRLCRPLEACLYDAWRAA